MRWGHFLQRLGKGARARRPRVCASLFSRRLVGLVGRSAHRGPHDDGGRVHVRAGRDRHAALGRRPRVPALHVDQPREVAPRERARGARAALVRVGRAAVDERGMSSSSLSPGSARARGAAARARASRRRRAAAGRGARRARGAEQARGAWQPGTSSSIASRCGSRARGRAARARRTRAGRRCPRCRRRRGRARRSRCGTAAARADRDRGETPIHISPTRYRQQRRSTTGSARRARPRHGAASTARSTTVRPSPPSRETRSASRPPIAQPSAPPAAGTTPSHAAATAAGTPRVATKYALW